MTHPPDPPEEPPRHEALARLSMALEGANLGVWDWNVETGEVVRTPAMASFLGLDPAEFGADLESWRSRVHPDDLPVVLTALDEHFNGRTPFYETEHRLRHADGGWVWVRDRGRTFEHDGQGRPRRIVGTVEDVTERVEARLEQARLVRALEDEQARLGALLEQLPIGVVLAEAPSGRIVLWNRAAVDDARGVDLAARSTEEYEKWEAYLSDGTPMTPDDWPLSRALAGETLRGEEFWVPDPEHPDDPDSRRWWRAHAGPILDRRGNVTAAVVISEDITEMRRVEQALIRSQEQLRHTQKMEAIGRLAGGMAHDFNNLLTAILGFGEFVLDQLPPGSPLAQDVGQIVDAALRGRSITRQLLAFGRKGEWRAEAVPVAEVVTSSTRLLERTLGAHLELRSDGGPPGLSVVVDPSRLEQCLMNLVLNARDAAADQGGQIEVRARSARLARPRFGDPESVPAGNWVVLEVEDNGKGIAPEIRSRVFEPFFTTRPEGRGTGLGLAMVYGIVKQAGGYVTLDSEPGAGTCVTLYLPAAPEVGEGRPEAPTADAGAPLSLDGRTVLLVEDQDQVRGLLARRLRQAGLEVVEATHGRDALERLAELSTQPDLVLTDVSMPEMDGWALARALNDRHPQVPVLFMSGHTAPYESAPGTLPIPEADLLLKPFGADELLARIAARLQAR